jgi:hypothetical protein
MAVEPTNILKVLSGAGFVAVPAAAALFKLDWYFKRGGKSTSAIFIAVAGLLSGVFYSYLVWTEPALLLVNTPIGWYLALAAIAVAVYYGLYAGYDGKADPPAPRWLLPAALLSYIGLLSTVGIFCAAALARHDYLRLGGDVLGDGNPLEAATVILEDSNHAPLRQVQSNANGRFLLTLKYSEYDNEKTPDDQKPAHLLVKARGFSEQTLDFDGHPNEHLTLSLTHK